MLMIPVLPALTVRTFEEQEGDILLEFINRQLTRALYSEPFNGELLIQQLRQPSSHFTARWQHVCPLCAWRAGELIGFLDVAAGADEDNLSLPDHQPLGIIRFVALAERDDLHHDTLHALFGAAETFWREQKAHRVLAFARTLGYPQFQAGLGILPGDWNEIIRGLTSNGYAFTQRFYLLQRSLGQLLEEDVPQTDLRLEYRRTSREIRYHIYHRLVEHIATARVIDVPTSALGERYTLHLLDIAVNSAWRNRNIGKWLLRRVINDATMAGYREIIAFPTSRQAEALILFGQQGFVEQNYRGYALEKELVL
ncbi:MAG: GNAT family N-acetyltransferase [Caldilineaceae bacterium]